jgi:hypothetical protein
VPERPKGTGCKPVGSAYGGSNPPAPTTTSHAGERLRFSPAGPPPTSFSRDVAAIYGCGTYPQPHAMWVYDFEAYSDLPRAAANRKLTSIRAMHPKARIV